MIAIFDELPFELVRGEINLRRYGFNTETQKANLTTK